MEKEKEVTITVRQKVFRKYGMFPSLEDSSIIKCAVGVCVCTELKREILCAPGSDYDTRSKEVSLYDRKRHWNEIVEKKARIILGNLCMPKVLQKKVMLVVLPIGMRMLAWAKYHEDVIGFSREYSINFLNSSFFTQQGIIDNKKAAEELIKDKRLNIKQKYKLACLYCFEEHIPALHRELMEENKYAHMLPEIGQPGLITFWSYYLMGEIDKLQEGKTTDEYRLEKAIESGCKAAVEYCLSKTDLKDTIVNAAVETVRNNIIKDDWFIFEDEEDKNGGSLWVPNDYYVDILCFLLSKMKKEQQIEFFIQDTEGVEEFDSIDNDICFTVLEDFLIWPYQDYFMMNARLMWGFLQKHNYVLLLIKILNKIDPIYEDNIKYGEERSYDYKGLLKEFWCQSPEYYKRYILSTESEDYLDGDVSLGTRFLLRLFTLVNFTEEDGENISLIFASATEIKSFLSFTAQESICSWLIHREQWQILDWFMLIYFTSKEQVAETKRTFTFKERARRICIDFALFDKWDTLNTFMEWSALSKEEINIFKTKLIYSEDGMFACVHLLHQDKGLEDVNRFIKWCLPSEEEVKAFKKELIFSFIGFNTCANLIQVGQLELASQYINSCLCSEEAIKEFRKQVLYEVGSFIFEKLITGYSIEDAGYIGESVTKFVGPKWEEVEKCLTWCFSSEKEIDDFKKNRLLKMSGVNIHSNLIKSNQWTEAETFFAWLRLSAEEIKELKKETLFYSPVACMFTDLLFGDEVSADYGSREEAMELLLRWCLIDKEAVLEFNYKIKSKYLYTFKYNVGLFNTFDLIIKQHLRDLDEEQIAVRGNLMHILPTKGL